MNFHFQFDDFDPKETRVLEIPFEQLPSLAARARRLLEKRTSEEISIAAETTEWLIDSYFKNDPRNIDGYDKSFGGLRRIDRNDVEALKQCIGLYDLDNEEEFPNGREYEYFAALALWKIADSLKRYEHGPEPAGTALAGNEALQAMEAVCWAERLMDSQAERVVEERVRERISVRAMMAADARHAPVRLIKNRVRNDWIANKEAYKCNKSDFARIYARKILMENEIKIEASTIATRWLKDL